MSRLAIAKSWDGPSISRAAARIANTEIDFGLDDRLLPIEAVVQLSGLSRSSIYRHIRNGTFPKACKPGGMSSRWSEKEIQIWRDNLLAERGAE